MGEHPAITSLRQFLLLAKLADAEAVKVNLESGRLRGNFSGLDIAHLLQQVCDYNLGRLAGGAAATSSDDLRFARATQQCVPLQYLPAHTPLSVSIAIPTAATELGGWLAEYYREGWSKPLATVAVARVVQREALAAWRHAFCRKYTVASHMELTDGTSRAPHVMAYTIGLTSAREPRPQVPAGLRPGGSEGGAGGGGCVQCGRTVKLKSCSRCHAVWYCCRGCQKAHWRHHKPQCQAASAS